MQTCFNKGEPSMGNNIVFSLIGADGASTTQSANFIQLIIHAGPVVKLVLLILVAFSITSWAITFLKWMVLRKARSENEVFLKVFWETRQLDEIFNSGKSLQQSPLASVFISGYSELQRFRRIKDGDGEEAPSFHDGSRRDATKASILRALRRSMASEMTRLEKAVPFLATCGNTSPFIGLFGTVWGIMDAFHRIGLEGSASLSTVAPGISEALIATAIGLFAAIPAVVAFNFFTNKLKNFETEMESFASDFMNILERHIL